MDTLVLNPDRCVREAIREMLEDGGDRVVVARNTVEGLGAVKRDKFDVVILDRRFANTKLGRAFKMSLVRLGQDALVVTAAPRESWGKLSVGSRKSRVTKPITSKAVVTFRPIRKEKRHAVSTG